MPWHDNETAIPMAKALKHKSLRDHVTGKGPSFGTLCRWYTAGKVVNGVRVKLESFRPVLCAEAKVWTTEEAIGRFVSGLRRAHENPGQRAGTVSKGSAKDAENRLIRMGLLKPGMLASTSKKNAGQ